jgi:phosphosulfolactate synthase (CoM biosynthesis protein A)
MVISPCVDDTECGTCRLTVKTLAVSSRGPLGPRPWLEVAEDYVDIVKLGWCTSVLAKIDFNSLIFETPQKDQQVWMVRHFGANVNLGNIAPEDVISLETIRQKLRGDTMPQSVIA